MTPVGGAFLEIEQIIQKLVRKYKTNNPLILAARMNVHIRYLDLPDGCRGYYLRVKRRRFIGINCNLSEEIQRFVCAHELGHDRLHKSMSRFFLEEHTFFNPGRYEREANTFAVKLLLYGQDAAEEGESAENYCARHGVPKEMVRYL